jgi:predicted DsbA family dithiol-disulfide isomerase
MIQVDIWSDFACPFCYIGKTHFDQALLQFKERDRVLITYRSFELDPNSAKSQNQNIYEVLAKKYGQPLEWAKKANERVIKLGKDCGLDFQMDRIIPTNSFDAHRLNQLAKGKGLQAQLQNSIFKGYFSEGLDIATENSLLQMGVRAGLEEAEIRSVLESDQFAEDVRHDEEQAQEYGISGVPFFLFNEKYGVSGAQPTEAFLEALMELKRI